MKETSARKENKCISISKILNILISIIAIIISLFSLIENRRIANEQMNQNERLLYLENDLSAMQRREEHIIEIYEELQGLVMNVKLGLPNNFSNLDYYYKSSYFKNEYEEKMNNLSNLTDILFNFVDKNAVFINDEIRTNVFLFDMSVLSISTTYREMLEDILKLESIESETVITDFEDELSQLQDLINKIKTLIDIVLADYFNQTPL